MKTIARVMMLALSAIIVGIPMVTARADAPPWYHGPHNFAASVPDWDIVGVEVPVPSTSYAVTVNSPACQGNTNDGNEILAIIVNTFGSQLADSPDPATSIAGYALEVTSWVMPTNKTQDYANCAMPCAIVPSDLRITQVAALYRNNEGGWHGIGPRDFDRDSPGDDGFFKIQKLAPKAIGNNRTLQCALFRNWSNDPSRWRHVKLQVFINH